MKIALIVLALLCASAFLFTRLQVARIEAKYPPTGEFVEVEGLRLDRGQGTGAHRNRNVTHVGQRLRKAGGVQIAAVGLHDRNVGDGVAREDTTIDDLPAGELDFHVRRTRHHVVGGESLPR